MRRPPVQHMGSRRRRGFLMQDAVGGLILLTVLATVLAVSVSQHGQASRRLADGRTAARQAELALTLLAAGPVEAEKLGELAARVEPLAAPADRPVPAGWAWVRLSTACGQSKASLVGLVPASHLPKTEAP